MAEPLSKEKLRLKAAARLRLQAQPATVATSPATVASDDRFAFMDAPDFAGESFFDERVGELQKQREELEGTSIFEMNPFSKEGRQRFEQVGQETRSLRDQIQELEEGRTEFRRRQTPEEIRDLPEFASKPAALGGEGGELGMSSIAVDLLAPRDVDKIAILEKGGWQIDMIQGVPKITNPNTGEEFQLNKPDLSARDVTDFFATAIQFLPAAKTTGAVKGILKKVFTGAATSAATETGKQGLEAALGGKFDGSEIGIAGLFGGASELALPLLKGLWPKLSPAGKDKLLAAESVDDIKKLGIASEAELKEIQRLVDETQQARAGLKEATGVEVPVFRGQATGLPSDLLSQRFLGQLDPTSRKALDSLKRQNQEAYDATISVINQIAPEDTIEVAGRQLRDAAEKAVEAKKLIRTQKTSPLYDEAKAASKTNPIEIPEFRKNLIEQIKALDPDDDLRKVLSRFAGRVNRSKGDLEKLQEAKWFLDEELAKPVGDTALGKISKGRLSKVKDEYLAAIDEESTLFREANEEFARQSGPVDEVVDSIVGRISDLNDAQLNDAASKIFNRKVTPGEVATAKKLIEKQDSEAWNQIVRRELFNRVGGIIEKASEQGIENIPNTPGKLKTAIFGNENQRRVLLQAIEGEPKKNLLYLEKILESTASGRAAGSPTTPFQVIRDKLGGSFRVAKQAATSPIETAAKVGDETIFNRNARALADIMYDPQWIDRMSKIRALGKTKEAATELNKLFEDALRVSAQAARPEPEENQ